MNESFLAREKKIQLGASTIIRVSDLRSKAQRSHDMRPLVKFVKQSYASQDWV